VAEDKHVRWLQPPVAAAKDVIKELYGHALTARTRATSGPSARTTSGGRSRWSRTTTYVQDKGAHRAPRLDRTLTSTPALKFIKNQNGTALIETVATIVVATRQHQVWTACRPWLGSALR
jgi:hypothetical protein